MYKKKSITATNLATNHKTTSQITPPHSYANVVRNTGIMPAVDIKPKDNKQKFEATLKKLKECMGEAGSLVCDTKSISGCRCVISCANAADTVKVKQLIDGNDEYEVRLPQIKKPRVKISQVNREMNKDEIIHDIMSKNNIVAESTIEIKKKY